MNKTKTETWKANCPACGEENEKEMLLTYYPDTGWEMDNLPDLIDCSSCGEEVMLADEDWS